MQGMAVHSSIGAPDVPVLRRLAVAALPREAQDAAVLHVRGWLAAKPCPAFRHLLMPPLAVSGWPQVLPRAAAGAPAVLLRPARQEERRAGQAAEEEALGAEHEPDQVHDGDLG